MKKEREIYHLNRFRRVCPFFPKGEIEATESPDFIIHTQDKLGIEHTEVFQPELPHGGSMQAQEGLRKRIVDHARDLHKQAGGVPLRVDVFFNPRIEISKQDITGTAQVIAQLVGQTNIETGSHTKLNWETNDIFPEEITFINIFRNPKSKKHVWSCLSAGFIPSITQEDIQIVIASKESKLESYRRKCSKVWLLIVADESSASSTMDLTESAKERHYPTRFDRVFFFWNSDPRFVELTLAKTS